MLGHKMGMDVDGACFAVAAAVLMWFHVSSLGAFVVVPGRWGGGRGGLYGLKRCFA
jgi:hypothetical protein